MSKESGVFRATCLPCLLFAPLVYLSRHLSTFPFAPLVYLSRHLSTFPFAPLVYLSRHVSTLRDIFDAKFALRLLTVRK
jgi:hypothetical protein